MFGRMCLLVAVGSGILVQPPVTAKRRRPVAATTTTVITPTPRAGSGGPVRYGTYWDFCETKVPVSGAAAFVGKKPHPVIFSIQQTYSPHFTADNHYLGKPAYTDVEPNKFQLVGCITRTSDGAKIKNCSVAKDGKQINAPLLGATYRIDVYEATTANLLASADVPALKECPLVIALNPDDPKVFAPPADAVIARLVLPFVTR
jgi:hypothetical protein